MSAVTFDTLKFVKRLEKAGMKQAEAQNEAFEELTKPQELAKKSDITEMKYDMLKWIVGLAFGQFALLIGILMKLTH